MNAAAFLLALKRRTRLVSNARDPLAEAWRFLDAHGDICVFVLNMFIGKNENIISEHDKKIAQFLAMALACWLTFISIQMWIRPQ